MILWLPGICSLDLFCTYLWVTVDQLLRLEFGNIEENMELPVAFFTASTLYEIWNLRTKGSKVTSSLVRAKLEAKIAILRTTRHILNTANLLEEMMEKLPGENLNVN